ncbi:MAG: Glu-tRNA(Gln) amidotransferase subunit GatD [Candidatus Nanoarchaeia archaeon]|nr:Glu-tRNA(Gln) amidotransferase subunit GatD [Candidatus Nanoarchaeia archaeon]MDD5239539.1 Glu-tRNA(Gln) amidotransferase subunit GatD [Candidatus Nanoarchaeia archaeon]
MAKPGDTIKVVTKDAEYTGILIQRPEMVPGNSIILKLDNGYNIGIEKNKIQKLTVIKAGKETKHEAGKPAKNKSLPNVAILSTGGTISSKVDYKTGGVSPNLTANDFIRAEPKLAEYANYDFKQVAQVLSEDMDSKIWTALAKEIYAEIKKGKQGIIVTHGTDTMHYTSAAISFMVQNLPVPVVFVGAQRSVDRGSSDAFPNLLTAAIAATKWEGAEAVICMHESTNDNANILIRGTKARKMHTERRDAFRPINDLPLARVDYKGNILNVSEHKKREEREPILNTRLDTKVGLIWSYPEMEPEIIDYYIKNKYHGIVIAGTGLGHVQHSLIKKLKECSKAGIPVVMTSQCIYGRTNMRVYETGRRLIFEANVIDGADMTPETAFVKLMHVLGQTKDIAKVKTMMEKNLVGEISDCTGANTFLI